MSVKAVTAVGRATVVVAAVGLVVATGYRLSAADDDRSGDRDDNGGYSIALFGDMPYNALGKAQYPALLADVNRAHVAFSVHDGDPKAGGDGPCSDDLYHQALDRSGITPDAQ